MAARSFDDVKLSLAVEIGTALYLDNAVMYSCLRRQVQAGLKQILPMLC